MSTPSLTILQALRDLVQHVDALAAMLRDTGRAPECFTLKGLAEAKVALREYDQAWPLRDQIGKALAEGLHEAGPETDWFDARNVDELADKVLAVVPLAATTQSSVSRDEAFEAVRRVFCKLPRFSFLLDQKGNVCRVPTRTGNWVEFQAAHELFDPVCVDDALNTRTTTILPSAPAQAPAAGERMGRFGHHPEPVTDFCEEVDTIRDEMTDQASGLPPTMDLQGRIARAMTFTAAVNPDAIAAKQVLRELEAKTLALDPLDLPLPGDVVAGGVTFRKGVKLSTLVARLDAAMRHDQERALADLASGSVLQPWVSTIPRMQQTVLLTAIRGPDGLPKYGPTKMLLRWFRRCVLLSAMDGRALLDPIEPNGGSFTGPSLDKPDDEDHWSDRMQVHIHGYLQGMDGTPHHFALHFMHAVEILGYKHPDAVIRHFWRRLYERLAHDMHLWPETEQQLDERLGDTRSGWLKRADPATVE